MIADKPLAHYHPKVGDLWRSRHQEPGGQEFDGLPEWMITEPMPQEDLADLQRIIGEYIDGVLTKREMMVIRMRFWDELTLEECGEKLGVTGTRAGQIYLKAMRKLRHPSITVVLRQYSQWSEWFAWLIKNARNKDRHKIYRALCEQYPRNELGYSVYL